MFLTTLKNIKYVFLDVDGVLTDGRILVTETGEQLRTFNIKDGYAIQYAIKAGLQICIITGGKSLGVQKRFEALGVKEIHFGVSDKIAVLEDLRNKYGFQNQECLFIGDDLPDLTCMQQVGVTVCPADAAEEIKAISHYVSTRKGGEGIVREILEKILKLQGLWQPDTHIKSI
ncbi:HAD-IIIA family hydrolase [Parapedobacter sp. SGR-10]|uniref:KdsC family phosphatase n=1 Tax=Parapedobacter sp. SGR-10 TaxID=2710879 RepID=UPI0013D2AE80|nr:HAD-IIIA family hydrolase [Parapedobacter sp. SGR-10]NGF55042.1 HAD-IIIA family hydrolase [Parapedobacter sp. SGR-10]